MKVSVRIFSAALSLWVAGAWAQEAASPPSSTNTNGHPTATPQNPDAIHVRSSLVVLPVTVIDSEGNFVPDLSEDQFRVLDNDLPQRITQFAFSVEPVAAVIVI